MGEAKRVGIIFSYNENWIGGAYYILNLIEALKLLPEAERPELTILFYHPNDKKKAEDTGYPNLKYSKIIYHDQFFQKVIRSLARRIFKKRLFDPGLADSFPPQYFDAIFPSPILFDQRLTRKSIYWIPDFQEARMPHFFSAKEIEGRVKWQQAVATSRQSVVFSSQDALQDFKRLYPDSDIKMAVMQFAVTHPDYQSLSFSELAGKFKLPQQYFFCPNQFWIHKNQKVVLQAIGMLKRQHQKNIHVVFSGKIHDTRNENYFSELEAIIKEYDIAPLIHFLGFIDRKEQLKIMEQAEAVIQPSFFEGWSTVVEDVKAMNQNIIVSDLPVHHEQLEDQAVYFDPATPDTLVASLLDFHRRQVDFFYSGKQLNFAHQFLRIISE